MTIIDYEERQQLWMGGAMIAAAILCDLLLLRLQPSDDRSSQLRIFAFAAPILLFGFYFAALMATEGTQWSIHLWSGSIFLTGIAGLLLSYLIAPPTIPVERRDKMIPLGYPTVLLHLVDVMRKNGQNRT